MNYRMNLISLDFHLAQFYVCMQQILETSHLWLIDYLPDLNLFIVEETYTIKIIKIEIVKFLKSRKTLKKGGGDKYIQILHTG